MPMVQTFIAHMQGLCRQIIGRAFANTRLSQSCKAEIQESSSHKGIKQRSPSNVKAIKSGPAVAPKRLIPRAGQFRSLNSQRSYFVEHTRSNLG